MKNLILITATFAFLTTSCMNSNQKENNDISSQEDIVVKNDSIKNSENRIAQKITPCLWVETTDAKSVADYYLSIFKDGKLKEHHKYQNPPEAGGETLKQRLLKLLEWN